MQEVSGEQNFSGKKITCSAKDQKRTEQNTYSCKESNMNSNTHLLHPSYPEEHRWKRNTLNLEADGLQQWKQNQVSRLSAKNRKHSLHRLTAIG